MKSRLLPAPEHEDHVVDDAKPAPLRRQSDVVDTFDEVEAAVASEIAIEKSNTESLSTHRPALQVSARPQGRMLVAGILLVCITLAGYSLWTTFLRDAAFGVVTGKVTTISPPWTGTLTAVHAKAGDTVQQGDVLAIVDDPNLQDEIERLGDELRATQAELTAQSALLSLSARERGNDAAELQSNYHTLRGELLAEQSRLAELASKITRRQELTGQRAYSDEEIESLQYQRQGLKSKVENLQQAVEALQEQVQSQPSSNDDAAQLKPLLTKIENLQAELHRRRAEQRRGTIRASFAGTVIEVSRHVGEKIAADDPLIELLPEGSVELVLYVNQSDVTAYAVDQTHSVIVDPLPESVACKVTRIGNRLEKPVQHIVGRYRPVQKMVPVYLSPTNRLLANRLRLGSTFRLPETLFNSAN